MRRTRPLAEGSPVGRPILARMIVVGLLALVVAIALGLVAAQLTRPRSENSPPPVGTGATSTPAAAPRTLTADQAGRAFLTGYVDPDGRVVRRDQGGDTVSEGQAYGMLVSVGLGDAAAFQRIWDWTRTQLMRPDGTLSWRWQDGRVLDTESASDADLDAARALVLAGTRFDDAQLSAAGTRMARSILEVETRPTALGRVLTAGSWATQEPYAYNPSYASPAAYAVLGRATGDDRWAELAAGSRAATAAVLDKTELPPDWAQIHRDGTVDPMPGAAARGNDGVRYSYDAARMPVRYAESCTAADVALAARLVTPLDRFGGSPAARDLGGRPLTTDSASIAAVGQAAAVFAAGREEQAEDQLVDADHLQQQDPTYYGAAWDALGRMMLERNVLGGCGRLSS